MLIASGHRGSSVPGVSFESLAKTLPFACRSPDISLISPWNPPAGSRSSHNRLYAADIHQTESRWLTRTCLM